MKGIGDSDIFAPNQTTTRAMAATVLSRMAVKGGEADEILAKYEDGASVPAWAKEAVAWAVKNEIFGGYTVLDPMGDITLAQMAKMAVAFQAEPLK